MMRALVTAALLAASTVPVVAQQATAFPTEEDTPWPQGSIKTRIGELTFKSGYPSAESIDVLYDAMDFQRATQGYIWAPLVSFADWKNELPRLWREAGVPRPQVGAQRFRANQVGGDDEDDQGSRSFRREELIGH
jgi:hypothetical protein